MEEFQKRPPTLYGEEVELSNQEGYLGDQLGMSVSESVTLTLKRRIGLAKRSIYEIKSIVEDPRSKVAGRITTGLMLWESCVVPMLYHYSSTWM